MPPWRAMTLAMVATSSVVASAPGGIAHCLIGQGLHLLDLGGVRPLERVAEHALPEVVQADVGGDVDRNARLLQQVEVLAQPAPAVLLAAHGSPVWRQLVLKRSGG